MEKSGGALEGILEGIREKMEERRAAKMRQKAIDLSRVGKKRVTKNSQSSSRQFRLL